MEKFTYRVAETQSQDRHEQEMKKNRDETENRFRERGTKKNATCWTILFYKKVQCRALFRFIQKRYNVEKRHLAYKLHDKILFLVCIQKTNIQLQIF